MKQPKITKPIDQWERELSIFNDAVRFQAGRIIAWDFFMGKQCPDTTPDERAFITKYGYADAPITVEDELIVLALRILGYGMDAAEKRIKGDDTTCIKDVHHERDRIGKRRSVARI